MTTKARIATLAVGMVISGTCGYLAWHGGHKTSWASGPAMFLTNGNYQVALDSRWETNNAVIIERFRTYAHGESHPKVGDIYVSYYDNRKDRYALNAGLASELLSVIKITQITNGEVSWSELNVNMNAMTNDPGTYPGGMAPVSSFDNHGKYQTLIKPTKLSE